MDTMEKLDTIDKILGYIGTAWDLFKAYVIHGPETLVKLLIDLVHGIFPWDPAMNQSLGTLLGVLCFILWYKKWNEFRKTIADFFGSKIIAVLLFAFMHWSLLSACMTACKAGWIIAAIVVPISMYVNARDVWNKIVTVLGKMGAKGKGAVIIGGKLAQRAGKLVVKINWSDPLAKAMKESLDQLKVDCTKGGRVDDARFLLIAGKIGEELGDENPQKRETINRVLEAYAEENGIRVLEVSPSVLALRSTMARMNS